MPDAILSRILSEITLFSTLDILPILALALLEGILSVDNSLVLAILVRELPPEQRKKALTYGIVGAFVFRILALVFAAYLMQLTIFKLVGGGYLVYLAMKHMFFFTKEDAHQTRPATSVHFWKTVAVVELTDIAFSIDSITTAVAMSPKLVVVWAGGILGILTLRFAAMFFIKLLERLPRLEDLAYQLIFFIGTKLIMEGFHVEISHFNFWMMMGVIFVLGASLVYRDWHQRRTHTRFQDRLLERVRAGETSMEEIFALEHVSREVLIHLREKGMIRCVDHGGDQVQGGAGSGRNP